MSFFYLIRQLSLLSLLLSFLSTSWLYLYPVFHGCSFPSPRVSHTTSYLDTVKQHLGLDPKREYHAAPFRLLALGDPQLEGDTSLRPPPPIRSRWEELKQQDPKNIINEILYNDIPSHLKYYRKYIDLIGNDYYLGHIYRTLHWWTNPTHVSVLGDLLGSQWISNEEFARRGWRYWNRVFKNGLRVDDEITKQPSVEDLGADPAWERRIINIVGNHDIGYAGDMTKERMERFHRAFGRDNWEISFRYNTSKGLDPVPRLRIIVVNDLNLDGPAIDKDLQAATYEFINGALSRSQMVEDRSVGTILLTHVPLYKEAGVCVDGPFFTFHEQQFGGGVREQNHLSYDSSRQLLEELFGLSANPKAPGGGLGRKGIIINGHDHEGCDTYHHIPSESRQDERPWKARRWESSKDLVNSTIAGIREITLRAMMGDYDGFAGLLTAWFDEPSGEWKFDFSSCSLGKTPLWWAVHVTGLITVVLNTLWTICWLSSSSSAAGKSTQAPKQQQKIDEKNGNAKTMNGKTKQKRRVQGRSVDKNNRRKA
ncbi:MAG: hypothetical protein M1834_004655 [Cirrosporium novae-zelandiae]|nr:MAG: hypothetical protein M1834_004655 [Cirrosporium novae-zelandiae]